MKHLFNKTHCLSKAQLQRYLEGNSSQQERFEVEDHLIDCPLCAAAVDGFNASGWNEEDQQFLASFEPTTVTPPSDNIRAMPSLPVSRNRFLLGRIAAALAFLVVAFSAFQYWQQTNSNRLYSRYFEEIATSNQTRGLEAMAQLDKDLHSALENYNNQQYEASIPQFEAYLERVPENVEALLYTGIACLETENYQKADDLFTTIRINSERFFQDATWYLVLTKIQTAQTEEAVQLLNELLKKNESGFYADKARRLLEELR